MSRSLRPIFEPETQPEQLLATAMQAIGVGAFSVSGGSHLIMEPPRWPSWANAVAMFVSAACSRWTAPCTLWESLLIQTLFSPARPPDSLAGAPYRRAKVRRGEDQSAGHPITRPHPPRKTPYSHYPVLSHKGR